MAAPKNKWLVADQLVTIQFNLAASITWPTSPALSGECSSFRKALSSCCWSLGDSCVQTSGVALWCPSQDSTSVNVCALLMAQADKSDRQSLINNHCATGTKVHKKVVGFNNSEK